jgi:acetyl esterase/lipase
VPSRFFQAIGDIARHLPEVRRNPLGALDSLSPSVSVRVDRDIPYGPHGGQSLDLYLPGSWGQVPVSTEASRRADAGLAARQVAAPRPDTDLATRAAVVFFHGGRWSYGQKEEYRFVAQALVARGYAVAVCNYRKYPSVRFPAFVEDGAAAIAWAFANLPAHGVDPDRIFLMGHSAGAHIAALATMDRRYSQAHGTDPDRIAGLVLMSGPFDFFPIRGDELRDIFGPEELHAETQPMRFVRSGLPPMLFLHGRRDRTVRPWSSARMASAVRDHGGEARAVFYDILTHTNILASLSDGIGFLFAPVLEDVSAFLKKRIAEIDAKARAAAGS